MKTRIAVLSVVLMLAVVAAFAHGGADHVMGTVIKTSSNTIDVKTAKGKTVQVMFDEKTTFLKAGARIQATELKEGDRVVIDAGEMKDMKGMLNAKSVKVGASSGKSKTAKAHSHND